MKIYKEYMDSVKAPEELIERTRRKMQAAAAAGTVSASPAAAENTAASPAVRGNAPLRLSSAAKPSSGRRRALLLLPAAGAAAAAVIVLTVFFPGKASSPDISRQTASSQTVVWQTASVSAGKQMPETGGSESAAAGSGVPEATALFSAERLGELFPGFEKVREEHSAETSVCYLRKGTASVRYLLSADGSGVPEELKSVTPQDLGGTEVRLAVSPDGSYHYAVWEDGGVTRFMTLGSFPEEELTAFLNNFAGRM